MLIVKLEMKDGTTDFKNCNDVSELSLVNVVKFKVIRDERVTK